MVEVQCILLIEEKKAAFIAKKKLKPQGGEFSKCEVVFRVAILVGGGFNSWEGRTPPILRYPTWFGKPLPPLTTSSTWKNHPP